ncbi:hypothetical protein C2845_PM03G23760 [Panicum miliaceum]|uniref:DUF8039 domain-containing protein n=1 Tax=Panicum miliaceum TaxID=4540 RepID=A0A3L6T753_PANMI|nr:hypothetical protein C2845_PM03G23760 [Panicum miliaceum]
MWPRTQAKWPTDVVKVEGINGEGFPTNDNGLKWWRLICGLITRQRVGINVNFEDVDEPARQGLFETMKEYLEFPEGTSKAQMNHVRGVAWKSITKLHRHFKSKLKKKKKRSSVDPDRFKQEIMDEIFGKIRAAGIDVDAALGASIVKSGCTSKEVEQPLVSPAGQHILPSPSEHILPSSSGHSLPSPGGHSLPSPGGHNLPSPNTFDRINGPTPCSLITRSFSMMLIELGQRVVLPEEKVCHTVLVQDGYVVVKIDHVHQNTEAIPLDIPPPDAEIFTMRDARNTRIQWKKSGILIPPMGRSSSTGGAQKRTRTPTPCPLSPMVQMSQPPSQKIDQTTKDQMPEPVTIVASGSPPKKKG